MAALEPKKTMEFQNKLVLAPMVRIGTLPTRLVALDYGADFVYTEEIIDLRMLQSKRVENEMLGTVDFVMDDDSLTFRTCRKEKDYVVFQIGTSDAQRALKVAKMIERDVAAIDLNMGCPKEYSTKGGMGAALLSEPDIVKDILTTLVNNLSIPVTCKMRILPTVEETIAFVKMLESTGVSAIAVHGRYREERPRHQCHNDMIKLIAETVKTPIIANGGSKCQIKKYEDIEKFRTSCGAAAVMLARAAQWDPSIFRAEGPVPIHDTCKRYCKYALEYDSPPTNVKYNVQQLLRAEMELPRGQALLASGTMYEISLIWDLDKFYEGKVKEWNEYKNLKMSLCKPQLRKMDDGIDIWEMEFRYYKREYSANITPKFMLDKWIRETDRDRAIYETEEKTTKQFFYSVVTVDGVKYASTLWDKSKRAAEQSAAAVFLRKHGMPDGRKEWPGQDGIDDTSKSSNKDATEKSDEKTEPTAQGSTEGVASEDAENNGPIVDTASVNEVASENQTIQSKSSNEQGRSETMEILPMNPMEKIQGDRSDSANAESMMRRQAFKRQGSMTLLIDDIIEKQIRLSQDEPVQPGPDCTLINNFVVNAMQMDLPQQKEEDEEKDQ